MVPSTCLSTQNSSVKAEYCAACVRSACKPVSSNNAAGHSLKYIRQLRRRTGSFWEGVYRYLLSLHWVLSFGLLMLEPWPWVTSYSSGCAWCSKMSDVLGAVQCAVSVVCNVSPDVSFSYVLFFFFLCNDACQAHLPLARALAACLHKGIYSCSLAYHS